MHTRMVFFSKLLKIIVIIFAISGIPAFTRLFLEKAYSSIQYPTSLIAFISGFLLYTLLWFLYLSKRGHFWSTLEHELTHALFALLFFKKIHTISASRQKGGLIRIEGGNTVIALAPYIFPLAPLIILIFLFLLPDKFEVYIFFLLGVTYQFHLINLAVEFHSGQSDLQKSGYLFSFILILFFNLVFLGLIFSVFDGEFHSFYQFIWDGGSITLNYVLLVFRMSLDQIKLMVTNII